MRPNNQIQAGYIILTENSNSNQYKVAINPSQISSICNISCCGGCFARVYMCGREHPYDTAEAFDEILQLIDEYNKQHKENSNYE